MAGKSIKKSKRSPVVVVMGHVDHGKTSLLDWIKKTKIAEKEAGGITQSIGAYEIWHTPTQINADNKQINADKNANKRKSDISVNQRENLRESALSEGKRVTFIDTPGHEAFRAMRKRGATVADIAVLVVAADESVKPQTTESIKILKETETPFVVAITKVDRPTANIQKVQNDLSSAGVFLEGYGGDISWQGVSSKTGEGVNELLDFILLLAELLDLNFDPAGNAQGFIIEAKKDSQRGIIASVILKNGVLRQDQDIATRTAEGKVRNLENFAGKPVEELFPSGPGRVVGFNEMPLIGEEFMAGEVKLFEFRPAEEKIAVAAVIEEGAFPAVLKADVSGTLEVLEDVLAGKVKVIASSAGEITDGDVKTAIATGAIIVGFRVSPSRGAENLAKNHNVRIFSSDVIYELVKSIEEYIEENRERKAAGRLRILAIFGKKDGQQIIGGRVFEGVIETQKKIEILRNNIEIGEGKIVNLQKNREDVKEAIEGDECGLLVNSKITFREGDEISQGEA
jgi:translation initiation factor IF-2